MLSGKVAVVTGSGRGLGRAYAVALARAGCAVVVNDLDGDAAQESVELVEKAGGRATAVVAPVGGSDVADELVRVAVSTFGRLDVMCTNAGALRDKTLHKMTDEDFDLVIKSHLYGTFTCGRAAVNQFREQGEGGRLVLVASPAAMRGGVGQTSYAAAKAATTGLVRAWATELQRSNVTVNAIVPVALTRMVASIPGMAEAVEAAERGEPVPAELRRRGFGTPDDVASLVVFLCSDEASLITGQCIGIGGDRMTLWSHPVEAVTAFRDGGWPVEEISESFDSIFGGRLMAFSRPPRKTPTPQEKS